MRRLLAIVLLAAISGVALLHVQAAESSTRPRIIRVAAAATLRFDTAIQDGRLVLYHEGLLVREDDVFEMTVDPARLPSVRIWLVDPATAGVVFGSFIDLVTGIGGDFLPADAGAYLDLETPRQAGEVRVIKFTAYVDGLEFDPLVRLSSIAPGGLSL